MYGSRIGKKNNPQRYDSSLPHSPGQASRTGSIEPRGGVAVPTTLKTGLKGSEIVNKN